MQLLKLLKLEPTTAVFATTGVDGIVVVANR